MEREKKYYDLMTKIRSIEPVLESEDELSADVMGRIEKLHVRKISSLRILVAGWTSAAVAIFLAGVMFSEIFAVSQAPVAVTEQINSLPYTENFKEMSKNEITGIVKERRKRDKERKLIIDRYLKKIAGI